MTEIHLSFFDTSFVDAEAAAEYRRKHQEAETKAWLYKTIGAKAAKKHLAEQTKLKAEMDAFMAGYVPSQHVLEAIERVKAKVKASTKPFLKAERALLGVEQNATKREVKNAYRRKARKLHPDVGGDAEAFKQLYAAYRAVLKVARD